MFLLESAGTSAPQAHSRRNLNHRRWRGNAVVSGRSRDRQRAVLMAANGGSFHGRLRAVSRGRCQWNFGFDTGSQPFSVTAQGAAAITGTEQCHEAGARHGGVLAVRPVDAGRPPKNAAFTCLPTAGQAPVTALAGHWSGPRARYAAPRPAGLRQAGVDAERRAWSRAKTVVEGSPSPFVTSCARGPADPHAKLTQSSGNSVYFRIEPPLSRNSIPRVGSTSHSLVASTRLARDSRHVTVVTWSSDFHRCRSASPSRAGSAAPPEASTSTNRPAGPGRARGTDLSRGRRLTARDPTPRPGPAWTTPWGPAEPRYSAQRGITGIGRRCARTGRGRPGDGHDTEAGDA